MNIRHFLFVLIISFSTFSFAQRSTFSGFVKDSVSGEVLSGAYIINQQNPQEGAISNQYGFFSLTTDKKAMSFIVSYLGYKDKKVSFDSTNISSSVVFLLPEGIDSKEIEISSEPANRNVMKNEMGRTQLDINTIKSLPVILGETDVLKTITLMPGIKQGGEGSAGFYVRGGGPDQNLVLLDEAVVYNPSHLLGFFSIFNGDAIKNIEVLKGSMPANYGGRLSSIVNVSMKDGNNQKYAGGLGIGLLTSKGYLEGPIKKGKGSFIVTARRTFIDAFFVPFLPKRLQGNGYNFYDLNLKANYQLGKKDHLFLSGYMGDDRFGFHSPRGIDIKINWGNRLATLRWNHVFNPKLFNNTTLSYNRYKINYNSILGENKLFIASMLQDVNLKHEYQYFGKNGYNLRWGGNLMYRTFQPGFAAGSQSNIEFERLIPKRYGLEGALFFSSDWHIGDKIEINTGLRYSAFRNMGPYKEVVFDSLGKETGEIINYKKGQKIAAYQGWEPRASIRFAINEKSSLKASYARTFQYVHLATTSSATLPTDIWVPSSDKVKPQIADQVALGYFHNFQHNKFEFSVETYYKMMQNQVEMLPGTNLIFNQHVDDYMLFGKGRAYGVEFLFRKNIGKTTGWIGYTLSKTDRTFAGLNGGQPFPYRYDRRNDLSIVVMHKFNEKWDVGGTFIFYTGNAITLPTGRFTYFTGLSPEAQQPIFTVIDQYTKINASRMPAYHRMDLSANYTPKPKKPHKYVSSWNFAIYNVYSRMNAYFVYMYSDKQLISSTNLPSSVSVRQVSLFPIVPSFTWNIKW